MVGTARSIEITKVSYHAWQLKSRVLMYSYATRGLGFLVRCARQLGQGRQRSGGSPLFMINHRSSLEQYCVEANTLVCDFKLLLCSSLLTDKLFLVASSILLPSRKFGHAKWR